MQTDFHLLTPKRNVRILDKNGEMSRWAAARAAIILVLFFRFFQQNNARSNATTKLYLFQLFCVAQKKTYNEVSKLSTMK